MREVVITSIMKRDDLGIVTDKREIRLYILSELWFRNDKKSLGLRNLTVVCGPVH